MSMSKEGDSAAAGEETGLLENLFAEPGVQIEALQLFPGPRGFAQEFKARFDAGVFGKAVDRDLLPQLFPAIVLHQPGEDHLQGDAVQRVACLGRAHDSSLSVL